MRQSFSYYSETVRVRFEGNPMVDAADVFVDVKEGEQWVKKVSYNSMSDDYAYTNARQYAATLAQY